MKAIIAACFSLMFVSCTHREVLRKNANKSEVTPPVWNFGEDPAWESSRLVLYSDFMKLGFGQSDRSISENYLKKAGIYLDTLIRVNPMLHPSLYSNGKRIYSQLIDLSINDGDKIRYISKLKEINRLENIYY